MQFNRDEYTFLSRRGSVPPARRSQPRRVPECVPVTPPARAPGKRSGRARRMSVGASRARAAVVRGVDRAQAFRTGVGATWTAFGAGGQDEFGGR
jgi:hypothetical protein